MRYIILGGITKVKLILEGNIMVNKAEICQKTRFLLKNVCFETRFGHLTLFLAHMEIMEEKNIFIFFLEKWHTEVIKMKKIIHYCHFYLRFDLYHI